MVRLPRSFARGLAPILCVFVLASCGSRFQSPAAVVDGRAISQDELKDQLDLALSDPRLAEQIAGPGATEAKANLTRFFLAVLIRNEVATEYAEARSIVVTPEEVDQALQAAVAQAGGHAAFERVIQERGITVDQVRHLLAGQVLLEKVREDVVARLANPPPDNAEDRDLAFQHWLSDRVAHADISVNPRFGRFDPTTGDVVPITSTADLG